MIENEGFKNILSIPPSMRLIRIKVSLVRRRKHTLNTSLSVLGHGSIQVSF